VLLTAVVHAMRISPQAETRPAGRAP